MSITAELVKELRARTNAPMMDCKKALLETSGDMDAAIEYIRKKGLAQAEKKGGRTAAEGTIEVGTQDARNGILVEINSETDFVARGDAFKAFAKSTCEKALANRMLSLDALQKACEESRVKLIAEVGENITIRRLAVKSQTGEGVVGTYAHGDANGVRIGVLVSLKKGTVELAKELAMQVAAMNPEYVSASDIPAERMRKEKEIYKAQMENEKKPDDIKDKIIEGKLKKWIADVTLVGQPFVKDPTMTIESLLKASNAEIDSFVRFGVGEGIEKKEDDFVAEVMAQVKG